MGQPFKRAVSTDSRAYPINDDIRAFKILLVDEEGVKLWTFSKFDALTKATEESKDIIQIGYNPEENIATAKFMDYGRFMYNLKKWETQKKKTQKSKWIKEVKFWYQIWENDLNLKIKKAKEFLDDGYSVKFLATMRWRENAYRDKVYERLGVIIKEFEDVARSQWIKEDRWWYSVILLDKIK